MPCWPSSRKTDSTLFHRPETRHGYRHQYGPRPRICPPGDRVQRDLRLAAEIRAELGLGEHMGRIFLSDAPGLACHGRPCHGPRPDGYVARRAAGMPDRRHRVRLPLGLRHHRLRHRRHRTRPVAGLLDHHQSLRAVGVDGAPGDPASRGSHETGRIGHHPRRAHLHWRNRSLRAGRGAARTGQLRSGRSSAAGSRLARQRAARMRGGGRVQQRLEHRLQLRSGDQGGFAGAIRKPALAGDPGRLDVGVSGGLCRLRLVRNLFAFQKLNLAQLRQS